MTKRNAPMEEERATVWQIPSLPGLDLFKATFKRFAYDPHVHGTYALGLIEAGAQSFRHGGVRHLAPPGTIIAVNPDEVHDGEAASPDGYSYRMLYFDGDRFPRDGECPDQPALRGPTIQDPRLTRTLAFLLRRLDGSAVRDGTAASLELESRLLSFWKLLLTRHAGAPARAGKRDDKRVQRARDYLAANAVRDVQLAEVARVAGLSPFHFLRLFADAYGLTPHAFLMAMRLEEARNRLARGEPIADVAAETGFADQAHLTRRFKAAYGVTPGVFLSGRTAIPFKTRGGMW